MTTAPAIPLLETKIRAPRRRTEVVERLRLRARVTRAAEVPLTLVSAPAGFGKTTLLTESFADASFLDAAIAWLSLDERDNDPALFWRYLIAALQTAAPGVGG